MLEIKINWKLTDTLLAFPNDAVNHGEADIQIEFEQFNVDGSETAKIKMVLSISY